jgi:hypothetical protein
MGSSSTSSYRHHQPIQMAMQPRKLTQEQLAFEAEIDLTYMGGIERGKRNPPASW